MAGQLPTTPQHKTIMHVDLNAFYPSCEAIKDPSLKGKPVIVIMSPEPEGQLTRGVVASCSYEARKLGIRSTMPYTKAKELCLDGVFKRTDFALYSSISSEAMRLFSEFSDKLEVASIDEAYLDVSKKLLLHGGAERLASLVKKRLRERIGLVCSIGVAPTRASAKLASDFQKPDGLTVVEPERVQSFLSSLEVGRVAGIGPKTEKVLNSMGIRTLGDLAGFDQGRLVDKFGRVGLWMWKVANGVDEDEVVSEYEAKSKSAEHTILKETNDRGVILDELMVQAEEVFDRVTEEGFEYRNVGVKVVYEDFDTATRSFSYKEYRSDFEGIKDAVATMVDRIDYESKKVRKVGVRISEMRPAKSSENERQESIEKWI